SRDGERKGALPHRLRRIPKRLMDVLAFQIWIGAQYLGLGHAVGDHADDGRNRDAEAANARHATHLARVRRYARELHRCLAAQLSRLNISSIDDPGERSSGAPRSRPGRCPIAPPQTHAIAPGPHWWCGSFSTLGQAVSQYPGRSEP